MYLEERVEQLEVLSVDQGRQIETIAKGVTDLTVTVNQRFDRVEGSIAVLQQDVTVLQQDVAGLKQDVTILKQDVVVLKQDIAELKQDMAELKVGQVRLESAIGDIQQTQQLILSILQDRLQ